MDIQTGPSGVPLSDPNTANQGGGMLTRFAKNITRPFSATYAAVMNRQDRDTQDVSQKVIEVALAPDQSRNSRPLSVIVVSSEIGQIKNIESVEKVASSRLSSSFSLSGEGQEEASERLSTSERLSASERLNGEDQKDNRAMIIFPDSKLTPNTEPTSGRELTANSKVIKESLEGLVKRQHDPFPAFRYADESDEEYYDRAIIAIDQELKNGNKDEAIEKLVNAMVDLENEELQNKIADKLKNLEG